MRIYLKSYVILLFFTFTGSALFAQTTEDIEKKYELFLIQDRGTSDSESALKNAFEILRSSEKIHYEQGVVNGYLAIAAILLESGEYEKSMEYLHHLQSHRPYLKSHPREEFYRLIYLAYNYFYLGFPSEVKKAYQQAAEVIPQEIDSYERNFGLAFLFNSYNIVSENLDSLYQHNLKAYRIIHSLDYSQRKGTKQVSELFKKQDIALSYITFGNHFLTIGKLDSARYYYHASLEELKDAGECNYEAYACMYLAETYDSLQNYPLSIKYYLRSIENAKKYKIPDYLSISYPALSRVYSKVGNKKKTLEYQKLHTAFSDSLEKLKAKGRNVVLLNLLKDHEAEMEETRQKNRFLIIGIAGITILLVGVGGWAFFNYRKNKERLLQEHTQLLARKAQEAEQLNQQVHQSRQELQETNRHTQQLQQKVNESFHELVTLAKANHPTFYARFQEVYPELHRKLMNIDQELFAVELALCAYIYLDFSSKEIAEYTFRSVRTIQNAKYRLRKKFGLESSEDLTIWMKELAAKKE